MKKKRHLKALETPKKPEIKVPKPPREYKTVHDVLDIEDYRKRKES